MKNGFLFNVLKIKKGSILCNKIKNNYIHIIFFSFMLYFIPLIISVMVINYIPSIITYLMVWYIIGICFINKIDDTTKTGLILEIIILFPIIYSIIVTSYFYKLSLNKRKYPDVKEDELQLHIRKMKLKQIRKKSNIFSFLT